MLAFFRNAFYYPNVLTGVLVYLFFVFLLALFFLSNKIFRLFTVADIYIRKKPIYAFLFLIGLMMLTRFATTFLNDTKHAINPDNYYSTQVVGNDFYGSVTKWSYHLLEHKPISPYEAYGGQTLAIAVAPMLTVLEQTGVCIRSDRLGCNHIIFRVLFIVQILLYAYFICMSVKDEGRRINAFLFFIAFLLGSTAGFGLERGNVDIIYSLLLAGLMFLNHRVQKRLHAGRNTVYIFLLLGLLTNGKLIILPFVLLILLNTRYTWLAIISFIAGFIGISYAPLLYGVTASFLDPFKSLRTYDTSTFVCYQFNHSLIAIPFRPLTCVLNAGDPFLFMVSIRVVSYVALLYYVFLFPLRPMYDRLRRHMRRGKKYIAYMTVHMGKPGVRFSLVLTVAVIITAIINLIPQWSAPYRAFYALPFMFMLLSEITSADSLRDMYMSMIFLCVSGLWVHAGFLGFGMLVVPEGIMNLFLLMHYYYLIRSSVSHLMSQIPEPKII